MDGDVMIAVDPHKASGTAAVLGPVTKTVIAAARFASSADGCGRLAGLARRREQRRWAVEGCRGAGRPLAVRLAALEGSGVLVVTSDDDLVSRRLLCGRREELTARRTHSVGRLHRLIAGLAPGGMRRELPAGKAQALLARIRPADDVGRVRLHIARGHLGPAGGRITVVAARDRRPPGRAGPGGLGRYRGPGAGRGQGPPAQGPRLAQPRRRPRVLAASWADLPPVSESAPRHRADQRR